MRQRLSGAYASAENVCPGHQSLLHIARSVSQTAITVRYRLLKATIVETLDIDLFQGSPALAGPIPPAAPLPFFQYMRAVRDNGIAGFHEDVFQQPIVETRYWRFHNFLVNDPVGIKHVLIDNADNYIKGVVELRSVNTWPAKDFIASDEKEWRQRRRTLSAAFDYRSIFENSSVILDTAQAVLARWSTLPQGTVIEAHAEMARMTLEIISPNRVSSSQRRVRWNHGTRIRALSERDDRRSV
jgi:cytochrome P450